MTKVAMIVSNPFVSDPRVYAEAKTLTENGYDVTIVAWDREGKYSQSEDLEGIHIRRACIRTTFGHGIKQLLPFGSFWREAVAILSQERYDVIHSHDLDTLPAGWICARRQKAKLVYDAHECYPAMFASHGGARLLPRLLELLERYLTHRVDLLITVGDLLKERFGPMTKAPIVVVGNWKDPDDYVHSAADLSELEDELSVDGRLVISFIGTFNDDRMIIPAIRSVSQTPGVLFLVAGRGDQEEEIVRLAEQHENVRFLGMLPMEEVSRYVSVSDVSYYGLNPGYPNNHYSAPNALFAALAAGKAVLTTNVGEIARIVAEEGCGIVLISFDADEVQQALDQLQSAPSLATFKQNAARAGADRYNWTHAQQVLLDGYTRVLEEGNR